MTETKTNYFKLILKRIFEILFIILILTPLWSYLLWLFTPEKELNILIMDKTVLSTKTQEHMSLSWILMHDKYIHSKTGSYNHEKDYFGFFPNNRGGYKIKDFRNFSDQLLDSLANCYQVVYYSDMYGIYTGEWYKTYPKVSPYGKKGIDYSMEHTRKIYGGMTLKELDLLKKMKSKGKLIFTEFNVIASPTPRFVRQEFEKEFDMRWSGWVGRYYDKLDTMLNKELPRWMKRNYLDQHENNWPFHKSGIVFVKDDYRIEILENNTHLVIQVPMIHTSQKYMDKYGIPSEMKYPFWFDIIKTNSKNKVVSTYKITHNSVGRGLLKEYGIPETFPAIIEHDSLDYRFYYFSGDFCDNPINLSSARFKWIEHYNLLSYEQGYQERASFFWNFYRPMIRKILRNYYNIKK